MISIVTAVYNGTQFIESCIKSVIDQDCHQVEHIIVDGGSKDGTVEVIGNYASMYPHIRWVSEKDNGQSEALNKGIAMADGDILGILNVDDFYEPNVLNRVSEVFKTLPEPSLLVGNCNILKDGDKLLKVNRPEKMKLTYLLLGLSVNAFPANPSAYFYHKSVHDRIGLYDTGEHYAMDLDFILRAVQAAKVKYINETWGNFRQIEGTKTYTDLKNGKGAKRVEHILESYRNKLHPIRKWQITALREFYNCRRVVRGLLKKLSLELLNKKST